VSQPKPEKAPVVLPKEVFTGERYRKNADFRNLLRICGTNVDGTQPMVSGISAVKGVGRRMAMAVCHVLKIDTTIRVGMLTDKMIETLESALHNPIDYGVPPWMVNRQHDLRTGENRHVVGAEIDLILKQDLDRMKQTRDWKGIRHHYGLKVRGQRTRCTGRKGLVVGYLRKKIKKTTGAKEE